MISEMKHIFTPLVKQNAEPLAAAANTRSIVSKTENFTSKYIYHLLYVYLYSSECNCISVYEAVSLLFHWLGVTS